MNRAVERHNMTRFTPVGPARDLVITMRLTVEAIAEGDTRIAAAILEQAQPESPDSTVATVAGCIGVALGLLDDWLTGTDPHPPTDLGQRVRLPAGHWLGGRTATDILVLARKGRAFSSLNTLITRQGGQTRPLRQRPHPRRHHPNLGDRHRHAGPRSGPRRPALNTTTLPNISHRVATMAGIRRNTVGPNWLVILIRTT
jgi:hypothetical protein